MTSQFSDSVLKNRIDFNEAVRKLREEYKLPEIAITEKYILERMKEASENDHLPENKKINERLSELRIPRKDSESMK